MSQLIEHAGVIHQIDGRHIRVQILQESACSSCHAKGACSAADMKDKFVDIESDGSDYKVGEQVTLYGQSSMGLFAVLLAFVIPFLIILLTLFILKNYIDNEAISGSIALGTLLPYFIILSFFNSRLKSKLKFQIKKNGA
jgi:sigma-E factor negative regulatory protein RseC